MIVCDITDNDYDGELEETVDEENVVEQQKGNKKTRNSSVIKIEERLNYLVENDINNPEIYELLKNLTRMYIYQNKYTYGYYGIEDVCHDVAADLYMNVLKGKRISAWAYYIGKMVKLTYVSKQRKIEHEVIHAESNVPMQEAITRMCTSSYSSTITDINNVNKSYVLDNISLIIEKAMSHTKFKKKSLEYLQLYTNVCLELYRKMYKINTDTMLFKLPNELKVWIPVIIAQFETEFEKSGFKDMIIDPYFTYNSLAIINDESILKSINKNRM